MNRAELGGPLLAAVSRSFYLTIRLLPAALREPIGLAYLLARTSDTIADTAGAPAAVRTEQLAAFERMILTGERAGVPALREAIQPQPAGEQVLIGEVEACLDWLEALPPADREDIRAVMRKIIRGQTLDLERFSTGGGGVIALQNADELEEYAYLVAGCVGEFWTRVCARHLPRYSALEMDELCRIGIRFGQGLQLVNILRDLPADLRDGRCYLPADELSQAGASPERLLTEPASGRAVFERWVGRAREFLGDGARYIRAIRPARVRMGCFLPWYLGERTLQLIEVRRPLETAVRVKVPRGVVYGALIRAVPAAFWNGGIRQRGFPAVAVPKAWWGRGSDEP